MVVAYHMFPQPSSFMFSRLVSPIQAFNPGQPPVKLISFVDYINVNYGFTADITLRNGVVPILISSSDNVGNGDGWKLGKKDELSFKITSNLVLYAVRDNGGDPSAIAGCEVMIVVNPHPVIKTTVGGVSTNIREKIL